MTIRYAPNAAAISWLALSQALDSRANMEGALFSLFADNTKLAMNAAKSQADNAKASMDAQSKQVISQGIAGMVGSGLSIVTTLGCMGMEKYNGGLAEDAGKTETTDVELQEKPSSLVEQDLSEATTTSAGSGQVSGENSLTETTRSAVSTETTTSSENPSATITGSSRATRSTTDSGTETEKAKDNQAEENSAEQKKYQRNMDYWVQNSSQFSQIANQVSQGVGSLVQAKHITDQGQAQAAQALAQGLSAVFNNQNSMLSSALSSCDSYMQNTNGTISALIQTSAARG